jgi:selenoprotein W-related protein
VTIQYCELANYGPVARHLEQAITEEFQGFPVDVQLVPSRGGVYEVSVNGRLIYSKRATLRLPDPDEIFYHVRTAIPGQQAGPPPSLT